MSADAVTIMCAVAFAAYLYGRKRGYARGFIVGHMRASGQTQPTGDALATEYRRGWQDREQIYNAMRSPQ